MFQLLLIGLSFLKMPMLNYEPPIKHISRHSNIIIKDKNMSLIKSLQPSGDDELKLMKHIDVEIIAHNWLMHLSNSNEEYDEHYYMDYFNMRGMVNMYNGREYFYIGYFPKCESILGPKYIGLFELQHKKRILNTKLIIENPKYISGESLLLEYKDLMLILTDKAFVFLNYKELNRPEQIRYYYEWKYN